jgi:hypothetical protein
LSKAANCKDDARSAHGVLSWLQRADFGSAGGTPVLVAAQDMARALVPMLAYCATPQGSHVVCLCVPLCVVAENWLQRHGRGTNGAHHAWFQAALQRSRGKAYETRVLECTARVSPSLRGFVPASPAHAHAHAHACARAQRNRDIWTTMYETLGTPRSIYRRFTHVTTPAFEWLGLVPRGHRKFWVSADFGDTLSVPARYVLDKPETLSLVLVPGGVIDADVMDVLMANERRVVMRCGAPGIKEAAWRNGTRAWAAKVLEEVAHIDDAPTPRAPCVTLYFRDACRPPAEVLARLVNEMHPKHIGLVRGPNATTMVCCAV